MELYIICIAVIAIAVVMVYQKKRKETKKTVPAGIQTFDSNGNMTLDYTESLTRVQGTIYPRTVTGSYTIDNPGNERIWLDVYYVNTKDDEWPAVCPLSISINGNTISWQYSTQASYGSRSKNLDKYGVNIRWGTF